MLVFDKPVVVVTWQDVTKTMNEDIYDEREGLDENLLVNVTVGVLYKETKDTIMVVQEFCGGVPRDWVLIPRCLILGMGKVKKK